MHETYRVVSDSTISWSSLRDTEIHLEPGLEAPDPLDTAARLGSVATMNDPVEWFLGGHRDGHGASHTVDGHHRLEVIR